MTKPKDVDEASMQFVVTVLVDDPITDNVHQPYSAFNQGFDAYELFRMPVVESVSSRFGTRLVGNGMGRSERAKCERRKQRYRTDSGTAFPVWKNPRKLKKAWKSVLVSKLKTNGICRGGWSLRWVPRQGWTLTLHRKSR